MLAACSVNFEGQFDYVQTLRERSDELVTWLDDMAKWGCAREKVIRQGMLQPMDPGDGKDLNTVVHGSYFALVDARLQVRGVYRFTEPGSVDEVLRDVRLLVP